MILILDHVRSAHNVGALFRTADGAGVEYVYLVGYTPAPASPDHISLTLAEKALRKTALGAENTVSWGKRASLSRLVKKLKREGCMIVALEQSKESQDYGNFQVSEKKKMALIVGNEVTGIGERDLALADSIIHLPMRGAKNSLNVAVAAGIALYHLQATIEKAVSPKTQV